MKAGPEHDRYDDVSEERIALTGGNGGGFDALVFRPGGDGPFPGIAIGAEATGINRFIRRVGATLAHRGFVTVIPDWYRGDGPPDPEAYDDIDTMMSYIERLDFTRAAGDLLAGIAWLRRSPLVDGDRLGSWGYCTGATLALLAAEADPEVGATVAFYPSQPDLPSWTPHGRLLLLYGDADVVMSSDRLAEVGHRLEANGVEHTVITYPGAGHAFCSEVAMFFDEHAAESGWHRAVEFVEQWAGGPAPGRSSGGPV